MSLVLLLGQYKVWGEEEGSNDQIKLDIRFARLTWTTFSTHCPGYLVIYLPEAGGVFGFDPLRLLG